MTIDTKKIVTAMGAFLFCMTMLLIPAQEAYAQRTVTVEPGVGTLNEAIDSDTTATGERTDPSTVYVLESGGTYLLDGSVEHRGFHLTIVAEDGWTERPRLIPAVDEGGGSSRAFRPRGSLTIRGLYVTNEDELGGLNTRIIRVSENDVTITVDNCQLDKDGQSGFRIDGTGTRIFLRNSIVSNIGTSASPDNGRGLDDRGNQIDTLWFENNTFYNITSQIVRDGGGGLINNAHINQNTAVNIGNNSAFELGPIVKGVMTNNMIVNASFYGHNTNSEDPHIAVVSLQELTQSETDSLGEQSFMANNNNVYLASAIVDAYPDSIEAPNNFNATAQAFVDDQGSASTFLNEDITFTNGPAVPTDVVTSYWTDPDNESPPSFPVDGEPFDFGYADTFDSYTGGTTGQQLGSLIWHGGMTVSNEFEEPGSSSPQVFKLNGNYPNPFNPTTNISFNLAEAANVSVDVFSVVGQRVMSIPAQQMSAGSDLNIMVDASNLTSGLYIYRVTANSAANSFVKTGRMTLIK